MPVRESRILTSETELDSGPPHPRLLLSDPEDAAFAKAMLRNNDPAMAVPYQSLRKAATACLSLESPTVVDKPRLPPSGDPHDYMSMSPYHWPDSDKPDGLPYVRRDGQINPEAQQTDWGRFKVLARAVPPLAWTYFLSEEPRYAEKAIEMVKTWFLDESTKMNPHMCFAGHVPGVVNGRSFGLTDVKAICFILDAIGFLRSHPHWSNSVDRQMHAWVSAYLEWLLNSKFGRRERQAANNHGTWYDVQVLSCALFVEESSAVQQISESVRARIASQFTQEGAQPEEMARTRPLQYCMMNLRGFFELATMLDGAGDDVWSYSTSDEKSLRRASEWLLPYMTGLKRFDRDDIERSTPQSYFSVLRRASRQWNDERFEEAMQSIDAEFASRDLLQLQYPRRPGPLR